MKYAAATGLLVIGVLRMVGDLCGLPALRGIGAATAASPAPNLGAVVTTPPQTYPRGSGTVRTLETATLETGVIRFPL